MLTLSGTQNKYANQTMFVPQRWFNAYRGDRDENEELLPHHKQKPNTVRQGDLQVHFSGPKKNKDHLGWWQDLSERHDPNWELPMSETGIEAEVAAFWQKQLAAMNEESEKSDESSAPDVAPTEAGLRRRQARPLRA